MKPAVKEIVDSLRAAQSEALNLAKSGMWVLCFEKDLTPFRTNGTEIRMYGGPIWTSESFSQAWECAAHLSRKAHDVGSSMVVAMDALQWSTKRVEALGDLIKTIEATSKEGC